MIRPEARDWLLRHAELFAALATGLVGLNWALRNFGVLQMLGWFLLPMGAIWLVLAWRRLRFASSGRGPGVVIVDEGEVSYYGPLDGGAVETRELDRLILDPTARPPHWILEQSGQPALHIPVNAEGSDALFDVFAGLPGIKTERMLGELKGGAKHPVVIWQRAGLSVSRNSLH